MESGFEPRPTAGQVEDTLLGSVAGTLWAQELATPIELERAGEFAKVMWEIEGRGQFSHLGAAGSFYAAVANDDKPDADDVSEFWEAITGETHPSDAFVLAFADAVNDELPAVNDELP